MVQVWKYVALIAVMLIEIKKICFSFSWQFSVTALNCQKNQVFSYSMQACNHTCRSLSGPDPRCGLADGPVEGCGCPEGTHLNQENMCTPKTECVCHYFGGTTPPGSVVIDGRQWWANHLRIYSHLKTLNTNYPNAVLVQSASWLSILPTVCSNLLSAVIVCSIVYIC